MGLLNERVAIITGAGAVSGAVWRMPLRAKERR
jgi:hypothetical protein